MRRMSTTIELNDISHPSTTIHGNAARPSSVPLDTLMIAAEQDLTSVRSSHRYLHTSNSTG